MILKSLLITALIVTIKITMLSCIQKWDIVEHHEKSDA